MVLIGLPLVYFRNALNIVNRHETETVRYFADLIAIGIVTG